MGMSKKHYQALAEALAKPTARYGSGALAERLDPLVDAVIAVADVLGEDNDKFNRRKFFNAFLREIADLDTMPACSRALDQLEIHNPEILDRLIIR
mgnify:CR=1 FL=1